jgi:hypothetical protein
MSKAKRDIRQRAMREMIIHSFFDWKSAIVLALVILLSFVTWYGGWRGLWSNWFILVWPIFGILSEIALAWSNLNDPAFGRRVVGEMLSEEFNPQRLQSKDLRRWVEGALDYRSRIETNIRETQDGLLKDRLLDVANEIEQWIRNVYEIAHRLDKYRSDPVVQRDRKTVPGRVANLGQELAQETDPTVRAQIEQTLQNQRTLMDNLERLESAMQRAELQLESTLAALGTVYTQTFLADAKEIDSGRAQRLREDIADQVTGLADILTTMDEIYLDSAATP